MATELMELKQDLNKLLKIKTKIRLIGADIFFLKKCLKSKIIPIFARIKNTSKNTNINFLKSIDYGQEKYLRLEIINHYRNRNKLETQAYALHLKLSKYLHHTQWDAFQEKMTNVIEHKFDSKKEIQKKKYEKLLREKSGKEEIHANKTKEMFEEWDNNLVKNCTDLKFSKEELDLLNLGLKMSFVPNKLPLEDIIVGIESGIKMIDYQNQDIARKECLNLMKTNANTNNSIKKEKSFKIIQELKKKDCFYLKADKGNSIVVLKKKDYIERMKALINTGPYKELKKNPLSKMVREATKIINNSTTIIEEKSRFLVKIQNPQLPKLYGLPKIHKPGDNMRPIVSNINAPTYNLAKYLVKVFSSFKKFDSMSVKNNINLIEKLSNIKIKENEILISFDVVALFPSIPIEITIGFLKEWLNELKIENNKIKELINLTKLCMSQNVFQFNEKFYEQSTGTAMGNPLSPFLAEVFMSRFETENKKMLKNFPKTWLRYVDDIFAIVDKDFNIEDFLENLNCQYSSIKFTSEKEVEGKLPFLDLYIKRSNDKLEFEIYRKKTHTYRYIKNTSNHCWQHKMAAWNSMVYRLVNIPMNKIDFEKEKQLIINIANFNGFDKEMILKLIKKQEWRKNIRNISTLEQNNSKNNNKRAAIIFIPHISNKISKIFKKYDIDIVSSKHNNLMSLLGNTKDKVNETEKSGIYQIQCENCEKCYIGQTRRNIGIRFKEHIRNIKNQETNKSPIAEHVLEENHNIQTIQLLKQVNNYQELNIREAIEMSKNKNNLLNWDLNPLQNNLLKLLT